MQSLVSVNRWDGVDRMSVPNKEKSMQNSEVAPTYLYDGFIYVTTYCAWNVLLPITNQPGVWQDPQLRHSSTL